MTEQLVASADLEDWLSEALQQRTRSFQDELGTTYAYLEGAYGGETLLLWLPGGILSRVLPALLPLDLKGRMVLAIDASPGHAVPFARALYWVAPRRALVVQPEHSGLGFRTPGQKEIAEGEWVPWSDARPARTLRVMAPTGVEYLETRCYPPFEADSLHPNFPEIPGPHLLGAGWKQGIPTYGLGLVGLSESLGALLGSWGLLKESGWKV
ncbi:MULTISPECIES: hypothetical protein [unclassified Meiothermus]|uniref:hypothetical protein n=1 Tax=unclassified Meiothermus TaxID=370471 RepID=UPI000D7C44B3|nr:MULTISPECIES: hypothetical protein [unclassified Meiothermus]PZA06661.1 hypothetical protein DNA98_11740 [Meiothermus sp. Pnk-1]RYM29180.1 hypothetical protein EWH23_16255 [Meiothermus sp. PNK-Is4]